MQFDIVEVAHEDLLKSGSVDLGFVFHLALLLLDRLFIILVLVYLPFTHL